MQGENIFQLKGYKNVYRRISTLASMLQAAAPEFMRHNWYLWKHMDFQMKVTTKISSVNIFLLYYVRVQGLGMEVFSEWPGYYAACVNSCNTH